MVTGPIIVCIGLTLAPSAVSNASTCWPLALIALATIIAFHIGLASGGAAVASTMAFATLTLARLFHGFNCRGKESIIKLGLGSNVYSLMAFGVGILLLALVLFVPAMESLFLVSPLNGFDLVCVLGLAFAPTLLIQLTRIFQGR